MDISVVTSSYFFLYNLKVRFEVLNDFWKCLPEGLVAVSGKWTSSDVAVLMESIRLLHAELCELLKLFSLGYGPVLLFFFVFSFINMLLHFFFMVCINLSSSDSNYTENVLRNLIPYLLNVQIVIFLMSVIVAVSLINEKKRKIISYLRLYSISNLPEEIKRQVKMFMNQILILDSDEITAFGFFNINLNLVISILVLLITGLSTLIQMKEHPIIFKLINDTKSYAAKQVENI
ncbi:unnamed protein product [Macrosiphum euphorbiae]|uniref:Gustatory receptor n=1 Tax=Macrosiphum euphorbiae TaxID=13131 RepID=A0AAV0WXH3_9HEMI|nr:unnamed protein product [Macrosiphum euphorbiae]